MRCACIDIGSNTTRLLVADVYDGRLEPLLAEKAFTRLGRDLRRDGVLSAAAVESVAAVVARQRSAARLAGAERLRVVATAAIRHASNGPDLCRVVGRRTGLEVAVLAAEDEARLAFAGATAALSAATAPVAVADVGGGSTELAIGRPGGAVEWSASLALGSGTLAEAHLRSDPPTAGELAAVGEEARAALSAVTPPPASRALAVGGSATSTARLVGPRLDAEHVDGALRALCGAPASAVAARHGLDPERVRMLPAGLLLLAAVSEALGHPLEIAPGGLREGVCLELAGT